MNYSTLKEVYNVDTFEKEKKKPKKIKENHENEWVSPASTNIGIPKNTICEDMEPYTKSRVSENIQPYYDEELEQYLNIQDFKNALPYVQNTKLNKSNYPSQQEYNQPDQHSYQKLIPFKSNTEQQYETFVPEQQKYEQDTRQVSKIGQHVSQSGQQVSQYGNYSHPHYVHQQDSQVPTHNVQFGQTQQVVQSSKTPVPPVHQEQIVPPRVLQSQQGPYSQPVYQPVCQSFYQQPYQQPETKKKDVYYKNLINIGLFIFVGILIIFLCDQIAEIAVNIGMKRTFMLLEPYLREKSETINSV